MRFIADGPSIPGELLAARDEGQVIFFCGSGVSRARAWLPDFFGLARAVMDDLHPSADSPARAVLEAARQLGRIDGVGGLIPADRIFSLLEREFTVEEVRCAVARSLRPAAEDASAHRLLLDLSRGTDGAVRLVTTNFDPLFYVADPTLASHGPPDLPDPSRAAGFTGVVYLHGRVTPDYEGPLGSEIVLSAADFGRAYLAEGWATQFIRALLARYQLVFVGYSADDPPVQYLLEALGKPGLSQNRIYAFQEGDDDQARALWAHKGVEAIAYDPANGHRALWETLEAWAVRARDPEEWRRRVLADAAGGPGKLAPHVRGQVAHVASIRPGSKEISRLGVQFPAEWLCVFDPHSRYSRPGREGYMPDSPFFDPFAEWGLDGDPAPEPIAPDSDGGKREAPPGVWSAFNFTRRDALELDPTAAPHFYGGSVAQVRPLPPRLDALAEWVGSVAHEPAALWWAANKIGLHPYVARRILDALEKQSDRTSPAFREAWRQLLAQGERDPNDHPSFPFYRLEDTIKTDGWSAMRARELADLRRPRLQPKRMFGVRRPPSDGNGDAIVMFEIAYPATDVQLEVPGEHLETYERGIADAVDLACRLTDQEERGYYMLGPLSAQDNDAGGGEEPDMTGLLRHWVATLDRLAQETPDAVRARVPTWKRRHEPPFVRVQIWAAGKGILDADETANLLLGLSSTAFWNEGNQRDLLHVIADRWSSLTPTGQHAIGERLLAGPEVSDDEPPETQRERSAWRILDRLSWLADRGCTFDFDLRAEMADLRLAAPRWTPEHGRDADESRGVRIGTVVSDTDPGSLLQAAPDKVIALAKELTGRLEGFVEAEPWRGLSDLHPEFALTALEATPFSEAAWAWRSFLSSEARKNDALQLRIAIAHALLALSSDEFAELSRHVVRWFEDGYDQLAQAHPGEVDALWDRIPKVLAEQPGRAASVVIHTTHKERDWVFEAINSPAGRLAELAVQRSDEGGDRIASLWLGRLATLLSLPDDHGRFALVLVAGNAGYLYHRAPAWTETHVLSRRHRSSDDYVAFWKGLFRSRGLSTALLAQLGPELAGLPRERRAGRGWNTPLAAFLLLAWGDRVARDEGVALSSDVLREALISGGEDLRLQVLHVAQRWLQDPQGNWGEQAIELLRHAWPRQRAARSSKVSSAVARLILAGGPLFARLVEAGRDLVAPIDREAGWLVDLGRAAQIAKDEPEATLQLLVAMLPEDASLWPYRTERVVEELSAGPLAHDPRLQDLRRRLSAR